MLGANWEAGESGQHQWEQAKLQAARRSQKKNVAPRAEREDAMCLSDGEHAGRQKGLWDTQVQRKSHSAQASEILMSEILSVPP